MANPYFDRDFLTLKGLSREDLELVFQTARQMESIVQARTRSDLLAGKLLGLSFFQSSTRTRISFESAMARLGGAFVGFADPKTTRAGDYYAESLEDVMRMMDGYADILVIRHPQDFAPAQAAEVVEAPVINAGDGYNEHPTQALLDMYTILRKKGRLDGLQIALVGDMHMRVLHSLPLGLARYDTKLYLVSPEERALPPHWAEAFQGAGLNYEALRQLDGVIDRLDVIYLMGTMTPSYAKGQTNTTAERPKTPQPYVVDREKLARAKEDVILMHPLPRTDELPTEVDALPVAQYFAQARYGVVVRMALLALIAGKAL
jgi:aspartate carbamoyltransferase catalytic subunit